MTVDLRTEYLGLDLHNPVVASSSPVTGRLDTLRRLEGAGAAAVILPSMFEEQMVLRNSQAGGVPISTLPPGPLHYGADAGLYLRFLRAAKETLTIPVIASLNGTSSGGWLRYASMLEEAGADALELNMYLVTADVTTPSSLIEARYLEIVRTVRRAVALPIAVKMAPYFSAVANMARRFVDAGADGLVLFNRFLYPDVDVDTRAMSTAVRVSSPAEVGLPLQWTAILRDRVDCSLAASTGIHTSTEVVKLLLAGADVTMMASVLLKQGPEHVWHVLTDLRAWMQDNGFDSVREMKGAINRSETSDPGASQRSDYMSALAAYRAG